MMKLAIIFFTNFICDYLGCFYRVKNK